MLCFGPNRDRRVTYTSPRRWLPGFKHANQEEAIASVIMAYLYAYGQPRHSSSRSGLVHRLPGRSNSSSGVGSG